jgi:hypothetical protein
LPVGKFSCASRASVRRKEASCFSIPLIHLPQLTQHHLVPSKNDPKGVRDLISINVFDDTADAQLTLWGPQCLTSSSWKPSHTILLLTNPGWRISSRVWLSITSTTIIDVDPCISDADWLRNFAQRMLRREHVNPPFPETEGDAAIFDLEAARKAPDQILFTLADLDEWARTDTTETYYGFLSLVILELHIVTLYRRNMILCNECCGLPVFANSTTAKCKACDKTLSLHINPKILGTVVDESGCVEQGRMVLATKAWEQLLGRTEQDLAKSSIEVLKYLEQRLLFLRVTVRFAWAAEARGEGAGMGRVCVWEVRM